MWELPYGDRAMKEMTHAELERHHYGALTNPIYAIMGMIEVQTDEFAAVVTSQFDPTEIMERIERLESLIAQPGAIPRRYQHQQTQLQGELAHVRNIVNDHIDRAKAKPPVSKYKGLTVEDP